MKRSTLLQVGGVAALAGCTKTASGLVVPPSTTYDPSAAHRLWHRKRANDCQAQVTGLGKDGGDIIIDFSCGGNAWMSGTYGPVLIKFHEFPTEFKVQWCKTPQAQCQFPNSCEIPIPGSTSKTMEKIIEHELVEIWNNLWGFLSYAGDRPGGTMVDLQNNNAPIADCNFDFNDYGPINGFGGTAYITTYGGMYPGAKQYTLPFGYQGGGPGNSLTQCDLDWANVAALAIVMAAAIAAAETLVGAAIAFAAWLEFGTAVAKAKQDGCF